MDSILVMGSEYMVDEVEYMVDVEYIVDEVEYMDDIRYSNG